METDNLWHTSMILNETNVETVTDRARLVGRLEMINELLEYINETT